MRNPRLTGTSLSQTKNGQKTRNEGAITTPIRNVFSIKARLAPDFIFYSGDIAACNKKMKTHSLFSQTLV